MDGADPVLGSAGRRPQPGDVLGGYRIDALLGDGGFASVYSAKSLDAVDSARATVALKISKRRDDQGRFRREYFATKDVQHPHVVRSLELFEHAGTPVLVMERVEGRNLRDFVRASRPPLAMALAVTRCVGTALQHMHARGWVHRDVKPSNILGLPQCADLANGDVARIRLGDFGLAKPVDKRPGYELTKESTIIGTLAYMPPEQLASFESVGAPGDVYCLAASLYFMIVGEPPFMGRNAAPADRVRAAWRPAPTNSATDDFPDLTDCAGIPPRLVQAMRRATARLPAERFQTVGEFLAALATCQQSEEDTDTQRLLPAPVRSKTMATDQLSQPIVRMDEGFDAARVVREEAGVRVVALDPSTYAVRLRADARLPFDVVPALQFPAVKKGWVMFDGSKISMCSAWYQTLVTEVDGKAVQMMTKGFETAKWQPRGGEQVFFSRARGSATHFCTVQPVTELVTAQTKYVGFSGLEIRFWRQATREEVCKVLLMVAA